MLVTLKVPSTADALALIDHVKRSGSVSLAQIVAMPDGAGSLVYWTIKGLSVTAPEPESPREQPRTS